MGNPSLREPASSAYSRRGLHAVRVLAFISVLIAAPTVLAATIALSPFGLALAAGYVWICKGLFSRLSEGTMKLGLARMIWLGVATLPMVGAWASVLTEDFVIWTWKTIAGLCLAGLFPLSLIGSAISVYYTTNREPGDLLVLRGASRVGALYLLILFIPYDTLIPSLKRSSIHSNQAAAVEGLRAISTAMNKYQSIHHHGTRAPASLCSKCTSR
jgi:hypothetical protein